MRKIKYLIITILLIFLTVNSLLLGIVYAADTGQQINVTLPTALPLHIDSSGNISTSNTATITNNGNIPIDITNISVTSKNGWSLQDYQKDPSKVAQNSKEYALSINGNNVNTNGTVALNGFSTINSGTGIQFNYDAHIPFQTEASNNLNIADVIFTVDRVQHISSISLGYDNINVGETAQPNLVVNPYGAKCSSITYSIVSGSEYVSVNSSTGEVTGLSAGVATIRVTVVDGNGDTVTADTNITITLPPAYAMLYSDGSFVFQRGNTPESGKTLEASYTGFENTIYNIKDDVPWYSDGNYTQIKSVSFKDAITPISTAYWFYKCSNMTSFDATNLNTSAVTNISYMFRNCSSLTSLNLSNFNTSAVTDMSEMLAYCTSLVSLNLSNFNTSAVTSMESMFSGCYSLTSLNLINFNTSAVTNMSWMFSACKSLTSLDLSNFDTSKVTDMGGMFNNCYSLISVNLSSFNTSSVTSIGGMFYSCSKLTSLNLSNFDTSKVTNMTNMLYNCTSLTSLDLSNFDTSKVTSMGSMFQSCSKLKTIYVSDLWSTSAVTSSSRMFTNCTALIGGNGTTFNSSYTDKTYARIDKPGTPGYLTAKPQTLSLRSTGNSLTGYQIIE